ncbi:MAG TPA: TolC family protein, partial [Xanthomonadaceae bacterium]|nr:TolC family protein [Xanthomonadaceae bacterium]
MVRRERSSRIAWLIGLSLLVSACTTVGPDYVAPKSQVPVNFMGAPAQAASDATNAKPIDDAWWKNLGDSMLEQLLTQALQSAPNIAEARARLREARALRGVVGADQFPTVDADGEYRRSHGSNNVPVGVPPGGLGPGKSSNLW